MIRCHFALFLFVFAACSNKESIERNEHYSILENIIVQENHFKERIFENDLYTIAERISIPDYVGNINQIKANSGRIYFNDKQSIYGYKDGKFEIIYTPGKGSGPNEISQIFRFDIRDDDVIAIAGYPDMRLLLHQLQSDTTKLIHTQYRGHTLIDKHFNVYGENSGHPSSFMITKFDTEGDSILSFGHLFHNQDMSLTMFDFYWDYNEHHDVIILGFMYSGYYAAIDSEGNVIYVVESIQHPGHVPTMVNRNNMQYVGNEASILRGLATRNDEIHIYSAKAMNRQREVYGALIDVLDVGTGMYQFSYVLQEPLHWPIEVLDDYSIVSVNENYELVRWQRNSK